ncbi:ABC transporter permease [Euzebya sp.]|uniref:ABC transporter permease n=1 Tax=Euzebya sp. TaxID=1971409 RepID=UPI003513F00F
MSATTTMTATETRLFLREPGAVFWALAFPALLLVVLGTVFPGAQDPSEDLGGARLVDLYAPIALTLGLLTVGTNTLPVALATSRELGVFRRLSITPVHPRSLLAAHLAVQVGAAVTAAVIAVAVGVVAFDLPVPEAPLWFAVAFVLAAAASLSIGLLIGSTARTTAAGQGIGMAVYFPLLFFAGVYFPREVMPDGLRLVSDLTPAGAAVQALQDSWWGSPPTASSLLVMLAWTVVTGAVAARLFRWG